MKLTELNPGIYKIRKKDYRTPFGAKSSRTRFKTEVHILRVTGAGQSLRYFVDHDVIGHHPSKMNGFAGEYEVVSRFDGDPSVFNCSITMQFTDGGGDVHTYTVTDMWALRNVLDAMPWLKKPFGYTPNRSWKVN